MKHSASFGPVAALLLAGIWTGAVIGPGLRPAEGSEGAWLLAGTATKGPDLPYEGVRVTLHPESTVTYSDADGDFLVPWEGGRGWITLVPPDPDRGGNEWCKRITLEAPSGQANGGIHDLGSIMVMPRARLSFQSRPLLPYTERRPDSLRAPRPAAGLSDTCRLDLGFRTDLWGTVTEVEAGGRDASARAIRDSLAAWIRKVTWKVSAETPCGRLDPFEGTEETCYVWNGGVWVRLDARDCEQRGPERPRGPRRHRGDGGDE